MTNKNLSPMLTSNPHYKYNLPGIDTQSHKEKRAYSVSTTHPLYVQLRKEYGLDLKARNKLTDEIDMESDEEETQENTQEEG
jgi:hypothetical protein